MEIHQRQESIRDILASLRLYTYSRWRSHSCDLLVWDCIHIPDEGLTPVTYTKCPNGDLCNTKGQYISSRPQARFKSIDEATILNSVRRL